MVLARPLALARLLPLLLLTACTTIEYTNSCRPGDSLCQRNQNAQTLAILGYTEAATEMVCTDPVIRDALGEDCDSR